MKIMMLSCKKATELIEKKNCVKLSMTEKIQLNLHTKMCKSCNAYKQESVFFENAFNRISSDEKAVPFIENLDLKNKILGKIKE